MSYFVVFQNKTFEEEYSKQILWAPQKDINGENTYFHWESMKDLRIGDIVFSIVKNNVVSRSIVIKKAIEKVNPFNNGLWSREGWLAELKYDLSINNIKIMDHIDEIRELLPKMHSPFNSLTGRGNQGYLYPISAKLGSKIDELVLSQVQERISDIFDIDQETAEVISQLYQEQGIEEGKVILVEIDRPENSNKPKVKRQVVYGRKIDFIAKAEKDQKTGVLAEELVVEYEKDYLRKNNRDDLAQRVKWVAKEADGYGYDVLSFDLNGEEKYIEVKATTLGESTPFEITANEVELSNSKSNHYWIYRVVHMNSTEPVFYKVNGNVYEEFELEPIAYRAYLKDKSS